MTIHELRDDASIKAKNGLGFILSGTVVWLLITFIFLLPFSLQTKNIFMLAMTGLLFPLAVGISSIMKADWKLEKNPLNKLGLTLNVAQFIYFPIVFWAFIESPEEMIIFFAVITGAHFFPYGWFYRARAYSAMAPVISIVIVIIGWTVDLTKLWLIPLIMTLLLLLLSVWLFADYKKKSSTTTFGTSQGM
ncbi:DUF7010 family protein [Halalkalibacterium halodurans]|uniref:DUF7010 family protein n=1 Tax=Halalkalibacterium halodurans TaxID=86665 RepID=UPI002AA967A7|nr:hypothetical protein [Halalkalibacterium halodurans]MDY7223254.1 hypothetical protein [Halalkalibacterium halodurans]MDY7242475.1 hypothetical protein [Halalkalibacterium halodurans]